MVKRAFVDKHGIRKGEWNPEEDNKLRVHIQQHGHKNWRLLPQLAGLARCGKSCRLRWVNYLKPGVRKGNFTNDEVELIIQLHQQFGNRWSEMVKRLPAGRTDNDIKNYWHAHIKKHMKNSSMQIDLHSNGSSSSLSTAAVDDGDSSLVKKPRDSSGSSATHDYENLILACDDIHHYANSWESLPQNDQQGPMDDLSYTLDMGNQQHYPMPYISEHLIQPDQPQVLKTELSSSNSFTTFEESIPNGSDHSVISSSDSQAQSSVLLQMESSLINEPATFFTNDIYQWCGITGDFNSSSFDPQAQLNQGYFNNCSYYWDLDNGYRYD